MNLTANSRGRYLLELFLTFSILFHLSLVSSYTLTSYEIKDLQGSGSDFILETAAWSHGALTSDETAVYTTCQDIYILGGYNVLLNNKKDPTYFERIYENLPSHNTIYYTFDYYLIDTWDLKDVTYFYFDDIKIDGFYLAHNTLNAPKICGVPTAADVGKINIYGSISHTASTLRFKVQPVTDELADNESFGFRNVNFLFSSHPNPAGDIWCGRAAAVTLPNYECACPEGPPSLSGSCPTCDESCASCFGTTKYDCFQCNEGYYFDGTQCSNCGDSCTTCEGPANGILDVQEECKECKKMVITYVEPFAVGHRYTLQLFPNTCDLSVTTLKENLRASPISQDSFPAFSFEVRKLSRNLYSVDLVLEDSLLKAVELNVTLHYLSAIATVPKIFIQSAFLQELTKQVPTIQIVLASVIGGSVAGTLLIGATGPLWTMISFQQFIRYFIYLNIDFPPQVEIFLQLPQPFNWSLIPNPLSYLNPDDDRRILAYDITSAEYQPPQKFVKYHQSSFFIENGATIILINISLFLLLLLILTLKKISCFKNNSVLTKIKVMLRFNIIARIFLKNGIPLALAVFLQLRLADFSSAYLIQNNIFAIISVIYILLMTIFLFSKLHRRDNNHLEKDKIRRLYGTLYQGMVLKETQGKYYHFLIFFRGILLVFLLAIPYKLPPLQVVPLIFCNLLLVYYLFGKANFEDKLFDIINKVKEILILISEICILLLVLEVDSVSYYDLMGWIIVGVLGIGFITEFLYVIGLQIANVGVMCKKISEACQSLFKQKAKPKLRAVTVRSKMKKTIKQ